MAHDHHPKTDVHTEEAVSHDVAPPGRTFVAFFFIAVLAALALFVGFSDLGPWKVLASLIIAATQASVLAVYLMDLRQADKLTWLIAASGPMFTGLQFLFTLTDYLTRYLGVL
jgi:caa(3)-type oxidase subunit IV